MFLSLFKKYPNRYTYAEATSYNGVLEGPITVRWLDGTVSDETLEGYNGPLMVDVYESDDFNYIDSSEFMLVGGETFSSQEYASKLTDIGWLKERCELLSETYGEEETHHGVLMGRFRPHCGSKQEAAILATIQSGYWPNWLEVGALEEDLQAHIREVSYYSSFGTSLFGGYYQFED